MSLKFVHQIIIFAGITISLIFAWFCFTDPSTAGDRIFTFAGIGSIGLGLALVAYEIHFLKKTKKLIIS
jgi:hypothetical protein